MDIQEIYNERLRLEREYPPEKRVKRPQPLVSVCVITYQHKDFIRDCLDGILMQRTKFPIEIIIGEDESTDGTREICIEYAENFPDNIRLFLRNRKTSQLYDENGKFICRFNGKWNREFAKGKYIAICEGDDYWTDPLKLQKQVEFLEENPDYVVTYHDAKIINEKGEIIQESKMKDSNKRDFTSLELMRAPPLLTLSLCFRNVLGEVPREMIKVENGDTFIISRLGVYGNGKYLENIVPASYRIHKGGIWSSRNKESKLLSRLKTSMNLYYYHKRIDNPAPLSSLSKRITSLKKMLFLYYLRKLRMKEAFKYLSIKRVRENVELDAGTEKKINNAL